MLTWMLLHDDAMSWVELHDWFWFLAFAVNLATTASLCVIRRRSRQTAKELEAQVKLSEHILAEALLKAARSFHFGSYRVEWCGDHPVTLEPRYCVKHVWTSRYRYRLDGYNEFEPMPSDRDDAFLERTNFSREVAVGLAMRLSEESDQQAAKEVT